jgi:hypothetical protein
VDTPLCLRLPNFWWLYGCDCRCLSFATRRTGWRNNSLVPIGTKFISYTGSNPTITASFCQTTIYIERLGGWFIARIGQTSKLDGIIAQHTVQY